MKTNAQRGETVDLERAELLREATEQVQRDCQLEAERYLDDTVVPDGGE